MGKTGKYKHCTLTFKMALKLASKRGHIGMKAVEHCAGIIALALLEQD